MRTRRVHIPRFARELELDVIAVLVVTVFCALLYVIDPAVGLMAAIVPSVSTVLVIGLRCKWW